MHHLFTGPLFQEEDCRRHQAEEQKISLHLDAEEVDEVLIQLIVNFLLSNFHYKALQVILLYY